MILSAFLKLDTSGLSEGVQKAAAAINDLAGSASGVATAFGAPAAALVDTAAGADTAAAALDSTAVSASNAAEKMEAVAESGDKTSRAMVNVGNSTQAVATGSGLAVKGLSAVNSANSAMSGTLTGTVSGAVGLTSALSALGVAAAAPIALAATLALAVVALGATMVKSALSADKLVASIQFDNATGGIETMRQGFEKLMSSMEAAIGLARELRSLTAQNDDIEYEKNLAKLENQRAKELAGLNPEDAKGRAATNARYDSARNTIEFDREKSGNAAVAADLRTQQQENTNLINQRRAKMQEYADKAAAATLTSSKFQGAANAGGTVDRLSGRTKFNNDEAARWVGIAKSSNDEAEKIQEEIKALEIKNKVLGVQANLYENRNSVVEIKRETASVVQPSSSGTSENGGGGGFGLSIPSDRLARIGGFVGGSGGAPQKMETMTEKIVNNTKETKELLARNATHSPVPAWG